MPELKKAAREGVSADMGSAIASELLRAVVNELASGRASKRPTDRMRRRQCERELTRASLFRPRSLRSGPTSRICSVFAIRRVIVEQTMLQMTSKEANNSFESLRF